MRLNFKVYKQQIVDALNLATQLGCRYAHSMGNIDQTRWKNDNISGEDVEDVKLYLIICERWTPFIPKVDEFNPGRYIHSSYGGAYITLEYYLPDVNGLHPGSLYLRGVFQKSGGGKYYPKEAAIADFKSIKTKLYKVRGSNVANVVR